MMHDGFPTDCIIPDDARIENNVVLGPRVILAARALSFAKAHGSMRRPSLAKASQWGEVHPRELVRSF
jgi:hypothetical protein